MKNVSNQFQEYDIITLTIDSFEIEDYISFSNLKDREPSIGFFTKKPAFFRKIGLIESCL